MKKYIKSIILIILLQVVTWSGICQNLNDKRTHSNSFQNESYMDIVGSLNRSPNMGKLFKEAGVKPDLLTGSLGVNIPLYSVKKGKIVIPLSVIYNSDADDDESICGMLGEDWNISANYSISRKVMGFPDDFNDVKVVRTGHDDLTVKGIFYKSDFYYTIGDHFLYTPEVLAKDLKSNEGNDMQYDEFYYSIPGKESGCFSLSDKGIPSIVKGGYVEIEVFPKSNPKQLSSFVITTSDGMRYHYGTDDSAIQYSKQTNSIDEYKRENELVYRKECHDQVWGLVHAHDYYPMTYAVGTVNKGFDCKKDVGMVGFYPGYYVDKFDETNKKYSTIIPKHKTKWGITKIEDIDGNGVYFKYKKTKQNVTYYNASNITAQTTGILDFSSKSKDNNNDVIYSVYGRPTLTFSISQTKHEDEMPCLESIDADPFIVSFNSTRNRKDLIGADKLNSIEVSMKDGANSVRIKKFDFKYEEKLAVDDTSFSYDLFFREAKYGNSPIENIGNPFYHPETISQEKNRLFLKHIIEVGKNNGTLPAFEFKYNNNKPGKKNPYPVYANTEAPSSLYDSDDVNGNIDNIFSINRHSPDVVDGRSKYEHDNNFYIPCIVSYDGEYYEYKMPFLTMNSYAPKDSDNGNLTSVIYPTGLKKEIQWINDVVDIIATTDSVSNKSLLKEKFEYKWHKVKDTRFGKHSIGTNKVDNVLISINSYGNDIQYSEGDGSSNVFVGYLRTWSAKVFKKVFGASSRASKETTVTLLDSNDKRINGRTVYIYNILNINGGFNYYGKKYIGDKKPNDYNLGIPFDHELRVNVTHGLLDAVLTYNNSQQLIKKRSYKYDLYKLGNNSLISYVLSTDKLSFYELVNFGEEKKYEYFYVSYQSYSDEFNYKLSEINEEYYYSGSTKNTFTSRVDYKYHDRLKGCFDIPQSITTTLNDGTKSIQEFKYVGNFKDLTSYYNSSACSECDELRSECYDECNTGHGGLRPSLPREERADPNYEPGIGNNDCRDYCLESYERCREQCASEGLIPFSLAVRDLYKKKCYGLPLETLVWKVEKDIKTLMSAELTEYGTNSNGQTRPYSFYKFPNPGHVTSFPSLQLVNNNLTYDSRYEKVGMVDRYDSYGNVEEFHTKNGKYTTTIWGYGGLYPVLRVENAKYNSVYPSFGYSTLSALKASTTPLNYLANFTSLRNHSNMANSLASFNVYNLKGGVESQYDANGNKSSYKYDEFGRLVCQKDNNGNIVNQYEYNYSSELVIEPTPTTGPLKVVSSIRMTDAMGRPSPEPLGLYGNRKFLLHITNNTP